MVGKLLVPLVIDWAKDFENDVDIETSRFEVAARPFNSTEKYECFLLILIVNRAARGSIRHSLLQLA